MYATRFARSRLVRHGVILGYHRINRLPWDPFRLSVTPEHFAQQLEILHDHAQVLSLPDLVAARADRDIPPRSVAITFDDGYADHLSITAPLLAQAGFPSTIFISTGYLGREFWWDTLTRSVALLDPANPLFLEVEGSKFEWRPESTAGTADRSALLRALHAFLLPLETGRRSLCLGRLADVPAATASAPQTDLALTEAELVQLDSDALVTIGCHTVSHPMLARLPGEQQRGEIMQSKQTLEKLTGRTVNGFSFPHGSKTALSMQLVRECGFTHACASHNDVVWNRSDPFSLPRIWVPDLAGKSFRGLLRRWL